MDLDKIYNGDCIDLMREIDNQSIDMILCDLPFGTTDSSWDKMINFDELWKHYRRIIKPKGCIALFASGMFTQKLIFSAYDIYKYKWIWVKNTKTNFINAKNRPMCQYEEICVFSLGTTANHSSNRMNYYPQGVTKVDKISKAGKNQFGTMHGDRPSHKAEFLTEYVGYPTDILNYNVVPQIKKTHTNEKPQDLLQFLIRSYTMENDIVLDNTCGTGSTLLAAKDINRHFIGMELNEKYFLIAKERLDNEGTKAD